MLRLWSSKKIVQSSLKRKIRTFRTISTTRKLFEENKTKGDDQSSDFAVLQVKGMHCSSCVKRVQQAILLEVLNCSFPYSKGSRSAKSGYQSFPRQSFRLWTIIRCTQSRRFVNSKWIQRRTSKTNFKSFQRRRTTPPETEKESWIGNRTHCSSFGDAHVNGNPLGHFYDAFPE